MYQPFILEVLRVLRWTIPIALALPLLIEAKSAGPSRAPPFELNVLDGKVVRLSDLKGKIVLLDLWATWCTPCLVSAPALADLQARFGSKGLVVLGISLDEDLAKLRAFVTQHPPGFAVVTPSEDFNRSYGRVLKLEDDRIVTADKLISANLPSWVLIDRAGFVRSIHKSSSEEPQLLAEIARLFNPSPTDDGHVGTASSASD